MKVLFHKNFEKDLKKLSKKEREKTKHRIKLFIKEPFNPILDNHPLKGRYNDYRSINITGDLRTIFKLINSQECIFVAIDTHSNLYS